MNKQTQTQADVIVYDKAYTYANQTTITAHKNDVNCNTVATLIRDNYDGEWSLFIDGIHYGLNEGRNLRSLKKELVAKVLGA